MFPVEIWTVRCFVPILLPNRNEIRAHLTKNEIYCPVHWPKPEGCESNIYDHELSLICDQRYGIKDMKRIVFRTKRSSVKEEQNENDLNHRYRRSYTEIYCNYYS
jgi:hypothetical protein